MSTPVAPLLQRPAWALLQEHHKAIAPLHLRKLFAEDPDRGERLTLEAAGIYFDYSKNRITPRNAPAARAAGRGIGPARADRRHVRRRAINVSENRAVLHVALRAPRGASMLVDGRERGAAGACGARPDERLRRARAQRRLERPHRPADQQCRQHRDRRVGSGTRHGVRGAQALQRARP